MKLPMKIKSVHEPGRRGIFKRVCFNSCGEQIAIVRWDGTTCDVEYLMNGLEKVLLSAEGYVDQAARTEAPVTDDVVSRLQEHDTIRLLHAVMGLGDEAGELIKAVKDHVFYGKKLDRLNLVEELGDVRWFMAVACDVLGVTMADVECANLAKLRRRYGENFSKAGAVDRDTSEESMALQGALRGMRK